MASIKNGWVRKPLGDVADVISGYAFKSSEFSNRGIPVIKIKNIRVGSVDLSEADRVDEKYLAIPDRYHVRAGDILISLTGSHISQPNSVVGRVARYTDCVTTCLLNQRSGKIIVRDRSACDLGFLFYALTEPETMRAIAMLAHGAASQANVSPSQVESVEVPFPPLPMQQRIAGILSAYDELIENSQRRIRILESMARALYREWFVHFRFPGYENHPCVPSTLGEIPQGWEVKKLGDVVLGITKGTTPTTLGKEYQIDGLNFIKAESIEESGSLIEGKFAKIDLETHELLKRSQLRANDILFSIAGVIGRVCIVPNRVLPANTNQALAIIRCTNSFFVPYLYMVLKDDIFRSYSFGRIVQTAQANVSLTEMRNSPLVFPPNDLIAKFNTHIDPLMEQIQVLFEQIQNLRRKRDLMRLRLLSDTTQQKRIFL